ncbi:VC2046/SO_2500 family protein [Colwellia sp. 12G3]|uniref:VC2046/SO_2500 family protein n=1 Tax=Colwellia sp. 12G3 TaxID=2058299 RepID=UPI001E58D5AF|nr:VC2046/SO_2500 family protein [Colwellia sp. 12G3]
MAVALSQPFSTNNFSPSNDVVKDSAGQLATDFSSASVLLHELQLGEQLNESVVQARRADFSLMLAMLTEDVREQSQFLLPQVEEAMVADVTNTALRKQFNLPEKAPLALSTPDDVKQFNQVQSIVDNDLATIHLTNAMMPKPLAFRDDKKHIESQVLQNTSLFTQLKYKQAQENQVSGNADKPLSQPLTFNAKAWLDGIQQSVVKAPLLN